MTPSDGDRFAKLLSRLQQPRVAPLALLLVALCATAAVWTRTKPVTADSVNYMAGGTHLVREGTYTYLDGEPETLFPPGYSVLVGLADLATDDAELAGRLVSAALSTLSVLLLYWIVGTGLTRETAFWAALAYALLPIRAMVSVRVLSESAYMACMLAGVALWLAARRETSEGRAGTATLAGAGLALGAAYLVRPEGLFVAAPLALAAIALPAPVSATRRVLGTLAMAVAMAAVMAPYVLFLHRHTGEWTLSGKIAYNRAMSASMATGDRWAVTSAPELLADETHVRPVTEYGARPSATQWARLLGTNAASATGRILALYTLMAALLPWGAASAGLRLGGRWPSWAVAGLATAWPVALVLLLITEDRLFLPLAPVVCCCAAAGLARSAGYRRLFALGMLVFVCGLIFPDQRPHDAAFARWRPDRAFGRLIARSGITGPVIGAGWQYAYFAGRAPLALPNEPIERIMRYARNNRARWLVVETSDRSYHKRLIDSLRTGPLPPGVARVAVCRLDATHSAELYSINAP